MRKRKSEEDITLWRFALVLGSICLVVTTGSPANARCGDEPGDATAVAAAAQAAAAQCGCCGRPLGVDAVTCIVPTARAAVRGGQLRRRCLGRAVRAAKRSCPDVCPPPMLTGRCFDTITLTCTETPCSPDEPCALPGAFCSPRCFDQNPCRDAPDCDDGNGCTADTCVEGNCVHECMCVAPVGTTFTCCPGPAAECPPPPTVTTTTLPPCGGDCRYFLTCGWPVCPFPAIPRPDVAVCTTEVVGQPCVSRGEVCDPGAECGELLLCTDSDPRVYACPISQRRFKQDVTYAHEADLRRMRDDLLRMRLATYRYAWEDTCGPAHLGFIIDDVGTESPAVSPDGMTVDLYGYASMAVAAIQAQQQEIEALKAELAAFREQLAERLD